MFSLRPIQSSVYPSTDKLLSLSTQQCPWSHVVLDFIKGLSISYGNTNILVMIDRFFMSLQLVPLPSLHCAFETTEQLFSHVFRYLGIEKDIVSNREAQFTTWVWRSLMKKLEVHIRIMSDYHPQASSQMERQIKKPVGSWEHPVLITTATGHSTSLRLNTPRIPWNTQTNK